MVKAKEAKHSKKKTDRKTPTLRRHPEEWGHPAGGTSHRLRRPDKSMLNVRGVEIDPNDDTTRIYPDCNREDGSWRVERSENALAQQKRVSAQRIVVFSYDIALRVAASNECKDSSREINRGERPMVEYVSVTVSSIIRVRAGDFAGRANGAGIAADCAGWIEACEDAFLG